MGFWRRMMRGVAGAVVAAQAGWDAGQTTRLNRDNFRGATGGRMNELLDTERKALFDRGEFTVRNSSLLEGVIKTYESFLLGKAGPILRVNSENADWNAAAERVWRAWWSRCDFDGLSHGADKFALWVVQCWKYGEFFEQLVDDPEAGDDLPRVRLRSIHPERVRTDVVSGMIFNGADGVLLDANGRRTGYRVAEEIPGKLLTTYYTVGVRDMVHYFEQQEPGQLRGAPWMASALPVIADIRELDRSVLAAMRTAAEMAVVMQTQPGSGDWHVEPVAVDPDAEFEIKRNSMSVAPQGWEVKQLTPEQPGLQHVEYRHDRLRELGRARGLSLLHVLADGSNHNYSSMRGDNQMLDMTLGCDRGKFERKVLERIVSVVLAEAQLMGLLPGARPANVSIGWVWPAREYIDPMKESAGQIAALHGKTKTLLEVCAERGVDYDEHVARLEFEVRDLQGRGLVHPAVEEMAMAGKVSADGGDGEEDSRRGAEAQRKAVSSGR